VSQFIPSSGPSAIVLAALALLVLVVLRGNWGWRRASDWRMAALVAGVAVAWMALTGAIEAWSKYLLWVHMSQHVLLTFVAAPLIVASAPILPLWRGLPWSWQRFLQPFIVSKRVRAAARVAFHPVTALAAYTLSTWLWHAPALYAFAAQDPGWHAVEHATFVLGSVLLWMQVVEPSPWRSPWSPLARVGIVLLADLQNTVFCGLLAFVGRPIYPLYEAGAIVAGESPLEDQRLAAGIMWVASQLVMLPAAAILLRRAFVGERRPVAASQRRRPVKRGWLASRRPVLEWLAQLRVRTVARWVVAAGAVAIVVDGMLGPDDAASNLAGTWPWNHWRGGMALAIVCLGNVACVACPFMAPRGLVRRFVRPQFDWPPWLRRKWLSICLIVSWFVVAECFAWWESPRATAIVIVAYFVSAALVDAFFRGASFCAWVCPLGQYQQCLGTVAVKSERPRATLIALTVSARPSARLGDRPRLDLGVLWMVITAAAFVTAALMTAPAAAWISRWGWASEHGVLALAMVLGIVVVPMAVGAIASACRAVVFIAGWRAMLPLGAAMWVAHLGFHLVTGWSSGLGALWRIAGQSPGASDMVMHHARVEWLLPLQMLVLQAGTIASIAALARLLPAWRDRWPWVAAALALGAAGIWIVLQPMAMRGVA